MKVTVKIELCVDVHDHDALRAEALKRVENDIIWEDHEDKILAIADVKNNIKSAVSEALDVEAVVDNLTSISLDGYCTHVILEECAGNCEC